MFDPGLSERLVLTPMKTLPHGVFLFFFAFPPKGWSTGLVAIARVVGRIPRWREMPAFPRFRLKCCAFPTLPTVARHWLLTYLCSPAISIATGQSSSHAAYTKLHNGRVHHANEKSRDTALLHPFECSDSVRMGSETLTRT